MTLKAAVAALDKALVYETDWDMNEDPIKVVDFAAIRAAVKDVVLAVLADIGSIRFSRDGLASAEVVETTLARCLRQYQAEEIDPLLAVDEVGT